MSTILQKIHEFKNKVPLYDIIDPNRQKSEVLAIIRAADEEPDRELLVVRTKINLGDGYISNLGHIAIDKGMGEKLTLRAGDVVRVGDLVPISGKFIEMYVERSLCFSTPAMHSQFQIASKRSRFLGDVLEPLRMEVSKLQTLVDQKTTEIDAAKVVVKDMQGEVRTIKKELANREKDLLAELDDFDTPPEKEIPSEPEKEIAAEPAG